MSHATKTAAFFDFDETLIADNSAKLWLKHLWRTDQIGPLKVARSLFWLLRYKLAVIDMNDISRFALKDLEGIDEQRLREEVHQWYREHVRPRFYTQAIELVEHHRNLGHTLVLLTAASPYISECVVADLKLHETLCTRIEVAEGLFTGRPVEPLCYGEGKVFWAEQLANKLQISLGQSYFYTDSFTDLPMLKQVGNPVATNPDPRLRRFATRHNITVLDFSPEVRSPA